MSSHLEFDWGQSCFNAHMIVDSIQFLVTMEFMAACFFKASNTDPTVL